MYQYEKKNTKYIKVILGIIYETNKYNKYKPYTQKLVDLNH